MIRNFFSLRKPKKTFRILQDRYKRKSKTLDDLTRESLKGYLLALQKAILQKDTAQAKKMAKELKSAADRLMPRTIFDKVRDFTTGIGFALAVAVLIRTMWFELYTIPTGSMRPTLKEEDYLVVSKTDFSINVPLQEKHFYFDPDLAKRGSIIVFNSAKMDMRDATTKYFYLFEGNKQLVKRLIGKPGDTIYFYGGKIYGVDKEGREITDFQKPWFEKLEHIPFIRFDGKAETVLGTRNGVFNSVLFHQMNQPVAKLTVSPSGTIFGRMQDKKFQTYADLWGMKHYAMARLLTKEELALIHPDEKLSDGLLYLELTHNPTLKNAKLARDENFRLRPSLKTSTSIIPLQQRHLDAIANHMTSCRFHVQGETAWRYGWNPKTFVRHLPKLESIPDGTYEFQDGTAYKLIFPQVPIIGLFTNGFTKKLPSSHPLYAKTPELIHKLFNLGIEFIDQYSPKSKDQSAIPSRYAYFNEGNLHLLGAPIIEKNDPVLEEFVASEKAKSITASYAPFIDHGAPTVKEILAHGIHVPEKMYMALGDNHAMSADSRQFGFVPEENLKGGVSVIFAPIDERMGRPLQPNTPLFGLANVVIWCLVAIFSTLAVLILRRNLKKQI